MTATLLLRQVTLCRAHLDTFDYCVLRAIVHMTFSAKLHDYTRVAHVGYKWNVLPATDALLTVNLDHSAMLLRDVHDARASFLVTWLFLSPLRQSRCFSNAGPVSVSVAGPADIL